MPRRIAVSTLNASTLDILNVIRENSTSEYQAAVPKVEKETDIPKVGEVLYGHPALANNFINALINRIALVRMQSATFNNPYTTLKKGYLEFGETVEEIFVNIAKVQKYDPEKAEAREFKRNLPDIRSAFHVMNWRTFYPVTIQDNDLMQAFTGMEGVQSLIAKIVDSVYTAAEYDEFLLFKYLIIKAIASGKMAARGVDMSAISNSAVQFRGISNLLTFMSSKFNESGVLTSTPRERQVIFMDAMFNAQYDVEVLAGAFNMNKAEFMGALHLIDDFTTFDNERFDIIRAQSDGIEEVTAEELALLKGVKAVILDSEWFQVYDNNNKFTEKYVASGLYWNYFYHTWKTISYSPFANAVVFVDSADAPELPASITVEVGDKSSSEDAVVFSVIPDSENPSLASSDIIFAQTEESIQAGVGITRYGAVYFPKAANGASVTLTGTVGGQTYTATEPLTIATTVGTTFTLSKG